MTGRTAGAPNVVLALFEIVHTARLADRAFSAVFAQHGMAAGQFGVLASVNDSPGITQAEVARRLNVRAQTIARPAAALLDGGLITTDEDRCQGRPGRLHITAAGQDLLDAAWPDVEALNNPAHLGLTHREAEQLTHLLTAVREHLCDP